jgi:hypothetical protein
MYLQESRSGVLRRDKAVGAPRPSIHLTVVNLMWSAKFKVEYLRLLAYSLTVS